MGLFQVVLVPTHLSGALLDFPFVSKQKGSNLKAGRNFQYSSHFLVWRNLYKQIDLILVNLDNLQQLLGGVPSELAGSLAVSDDMGT